MLYSSCFPNVPADETALRALGFLPQKDGSFLLEKPSEKPGFSITYRIEGSSCRVDVTDTESGWEYDLFNVPSSGGATVLFLRAEAENFLVRVGEECFGVRPNRAEVLRYCKETYGTEADYPFQDSNAQVVRKPSGKWYGLLMTIPAEKLGLSRSTEVDVINLKATPERIVNPDYRYIFPAWHMNRKYWISVLLDSNIPTELLQTLIDESYGLVK
ncbi:MAG: hypothetical protein E7680_00885 [Ruminococcaceae bacterium]|nr:hypothetical protein [Oscillospiraceae bacterium]